MRFVVVVMFCWACSFTPGTIAATGVLDAPLDSPAADVDDGPPQPGSDALWVDVETIQVPCLSTNVPSTTTLLAGVLYRLRASGTCVIGNDILADAEYWNFNNGQPTDIAANNVIDIGLSIDDPVMDLPKQPHWGPYNASHVYVVDWMGAGAPIVGYYHEQGPSNNSGSIELVIQAFQ